MTDYNDKNHANNLNRNCTNLPTTKKTNAGFATREETKRALRMLNEVYGLLYEVAKR